MILVTGGAGYIGSHTVIDLANNGYDVLILDNLDNASPRAVESIRKVTNKDIPFVQIDLCDAQALQNVFKEYKIDGIIHFAAHKSVNESVLLPLKYFKNNLIGFFLLLFRLWQYFRTARDRGHRTFSARMSLRQDQNHGRGNPS